MKRIHLLVTVLWLCAAVASAAEIPLRTAIFVENRATDELQTQVDPLNEHLAAELTEKGFSIVDRNVVISTFRETREGAAKHAQKDQAAVEDGVTGASALRLAQMLGADYMVVATITSFGQETRTFKGEGTVYGSDNKSVIYNLRIALKVLEGGQGGSVYGDTVTVSERVVTGQNHTVDNSEMMPKLIDRAAKKIAERIAGKVERIKNVQIKAVPVVEFAVNSNVEGATVELDGAVLGSTPGHFTAAPGLHRLRVAKQWLTTWERTVNVSPNQVLNVSLELSDEGMRRYATIEQLKVELALGKERHQMEMKERDAGIGIAKEQSEADAYAKKKIDDSDKIGREENDEELEAPPTTKIDK